jgi:hypothetical protein
MASKTEGRAGKKYKIKDCTKIQVSGNFSPTEQYKIEMMLEEEEVKLTVRLAPE